MAGLVSYSDSEEEQEAFVELDGEDSDDEDDDFLLQAANEEATTTEATTTATVMIGPRAPITTAPAERARLLATQDKINPFLRPAKRPDNTDGDAPAMAAHERDRKLPQKPPAGVRGRSTNTRKTQEPKQMSVKARIESLISVCGACKVEGTKLVKPLTEAGNGALFCRCCKEEVSLIKTIGKVHCNSTKHRGNITRWDLKKADDEEVKEQLEEYYKQNPDEKYGTVHPDEKLFRYRVVETFMYTGTPIAKVDGFRPLLQRAGQSLTDSSALGVFVPKIEGKELDMLKGELRGEHASLTFDGTTRNGEAVCAVARWCSEDFTINQRLVMFATVLKHMDHKQLAALIRDLWLKTLDLEAANLSWFVRGSCKVNGSATNKLASIFDNADDLM